MGTMAIDRPGNDLSATAIFSGVLLWRVISSSAAALAAPRRFASALISETALKTLESHSKELDLHDMIIIKHDMSMLPFLDDYFDGMISTHVIHHGTMSEISKTINEIFRVIRKGGIGYIIAFSENDFKLGQGNRLEQGTYVPTEGEERGIPHHLFTKEELMNSMRAFEILSLKEDISQTEVGNRAHFHIRFRKPK